MMSDGRTITYRHDSSSGGPTIDIGEITDSSTELAKQKIHFKPLNEK